jgi:hypothetical protein
VTLPKSSERPLDSQGYFTLPWRQWLAQVDRRINTNGADAASVAADVAAIATALGSPDGTVANIPDQDNLHAVIYGDNGIQILGTLASGKVGVIWNGGISNLVDVDLTGLADTYALKWDAASATWKPGAAGGVADGDKGDVIVSGSGATWTLEANLKRGVIGCTFDGGGSALIAGTTCDVLIPYDCTITAATLLGDQTGSLVVSVWSDTYVAYPPTAGDNIAGSAPPTISAALASRDTTLTGWTTSLVAGRTIRFRVTSCATITRATLTLEVTKT